MDFSGTRFLITGGTAGIGYTMALDLVKQGARVVVCGRDSDRLEALQAVTGRIKALRCDVRDAQSVLALRDAAVEAYGPPDVLINNAAIFKRYQLADRSVTMEDWLEELDINLMGALRVTHALLPHFLDRGRGTIVNVTSPAAFIPLAAAPTYSASKAALQSFTKSLRHQLRDTGVSVIELNPPAVNTQMNVNNPDVEGMKLWSLPEFSTHVLARLAQQPGRDILVGDAKLVSRMRRLAPQLVFNKMNPERTPKEEVAPMG
ncbi:MAG: SDR family NAD(P)-dependent oxidoreductase [Pseudomonadota bacterium]